jgi:tryptophanyl-tRNA synthetase
MRDVAGRFNSQFGETFVMPEAWIPEAGARIMALDDPTQKMSKSESEVRPNSVIGLTDPPEVITKKVKSAVTDSGREVVAGRDKPAVTNLLTMFAAVEETPVGELENRFAGAGYGDFKAALAEAVVAALTPVRERYEELMADPAETERLLAAGAKKAAAVAEVTMAEVRARVGLT